MWRLLASTAPEAAVPAWLNADSATEAEASESRPVDAAA